MKGRPTYLAICLLILVTALVSRICFSLQFLPTALWAAFFYFFFRILFIRMPLVKVAAYTFTFAILIECSQLCHAPLIDRIRELEGVHFLMGSQFDWLDILGYLTGIVIAGMVDDRILV